MRGSVPDGDLAALLEDAVTEKAKRLEARRFGRTIAPRKDLAATETSGWGSRYFPAPVRRAADAREGGGCGFSTEDGRRCRARERLEFHHVAPHARGGDRSPANIHLMCRTHNLYLAEQDYGKELMARHRRDRVVATDARGSPRE